MATFKRRSPTTRARIELDFDNWIAPLSRGNTLLALQRHEEAIEDYTAGIQISPGNAFLHLKRAEVDQVDRQDALVLRDYEDVLALWPQAPNREEVEAGVISFEEQAGAGVTVAERALRPIGS